MDSLTLVSENSLFATLLLVFSAFLLKIYLVLSCGVFDMDRVNMTGRTVMVTGASSGIGYESALALAKANARVILACRSVEKAEQCRSQMIQEHKSAQVFILRVDVSCISSVRRAVAEFLSWDWPLHVLINNAGLAGNKSIEFTKDGIEKVLATNHVGHFLLTNLLLDRLKSSAPSRVVVVSSVVHILRNIDFTDLMCRRVLFYQIMSYIRSKLANIMFMRELARRIKGTGVTVNALHPGYVRTSIWNNAQWYHLPIIWLSYLFFKTQKEGAQTILYLACAPEVENVTGKYFEDCHVTCSSRQSKNAESCRRLWTMTEQLIENANVSSSNGVS